ncbi:hypothetical protein DVH05_001627 [Phytophthora capsici]|nr:hypothetical protein DVH05_001627 [Phytophthora capsici]
MPLPFLAPLTARALADSVSRSCTFCAPIAPHSSTQVPPTPIIAWTSEAPPQAPSCRNYHDLLGAIQGLTTLANAEWYEPMAHVLYRLRDFATRNMDEDPDHSPELVKRTLDEVNQFLGSTFIHLSSDSPTWWRDFSSPPHPGRLHSAQRGVHQQRPSVAPPSRPCLQHTAPSYKWRGRKPATTPECHPTEVPRNDPRNADGQEPCLRFFSGAMCYGGTTATCGSRSRVHSWPEDLPPALIDYIKKRFGRRDTGNRRHS